MDYLYEHKLTSRQSAQLYRTIELDYLLNGIPTQNLFSHTDLDTYREFAVLGEITAIKPQSHSNVHYFCLSIKSCSTNLQRLYRVYIPATQYKKYYIKFLNQCLKHRGAFQVLLTQLQPFISSDSIVFGISKSTLIFALPHAFVEYKYLQILKAFESRYSSIKLEDVFTVSEVDFYKDNGIPLEDLKRQLTTRAESPDSLFSISGAVEIKYSTIQSISRKKCKVIVFNLYQTEIRRDAKELGVYNVKGFFYFEQQSDLKGKLVNWSTVLIKNVQRQIDDSGKLEYRFHNDEDVTVIDTSEWRYAHNLLKIWQNLKMIELQDIRSSVLLRNYVKLKVELTRMTFMKLFFECKKCRMSSRHGVCQECSVECEFLLWSECQVEDDSSFAQISIQGGNLIKFLGLTKEDLQLLEDICIKFNRNLLINKSLESKEKIVLKMMYLMGVKRVEKEIIGVPMIEIKKQVGLSEESFGGGFQKFKSLNVNGIIDRRDDKMRWLPKIKVHEVL